MADTQAQTRIRFMNPWVHYLQKLGLELKCPLCLDLYKKPMLLPCNHIFCSCCVRGSNSFGSDCAICKLPYVEQDLREAPYMENLVKIYGSMDASFAMHLHKPDGKDSVQCHFQAKRSCKEPVTSASPGNATSGTTSVALRGNERSMVPKNTAVVTTLERCSGFANTNLKPSSLEHSFQSNENSFSQGRSLQQDVDMVQAELSPDSPPSSGASKGVEIDCHDPERNNYTAGKCAAKKSIKRTVDEFGEQGSGKHLDSHCKRQKQVDVSQAVLNLPMSVPTGSTTTKSAGASGGPLVVDSGSTNGSHFICAFCQTWKITEGSGPMHHFANGSKQIFGNEAGRSNVVHLHKSCIEWTPQIYYEDDTTIRNVDKELARAEKLKCTSCGLKGAALGCFAKTCRRTYHAPCAYEVEDCRWDTEDYLVLCPAHTSLKFPSEKKSRKSATKKPPSIKIHDEKKNELCESDSWLVPPTETQNWVLCASALSADQKSMLVKFANKCGATVTRNWTPEVTHVIAATDANGACSRTLKVLMAILKGRWILKTDWINACMEQKCPVDEEPYEINLDNHDCCDGPRTGRLRALNNGPMLFNDMKFHFSGDFVPSYKGDLQDLIVAGGGTILESREELQQLNPGTKVVVYNDDVVTGTPEGPTVLQRQVEAEMVAAEAGSHVVPHTWLLGSIASNRFQPFV